MSWDVKSLHRSWKYATRIWGIEAGLWKVLCWCPSGMCQEHVRLWRQTMADVSGCFVLPYCHTESLSLWLSNDSWAAVYFCLHLYAQDPTLHKKSSCLQEGKMFILKNASLIRCLGKSCLWGAKRRLARGAPLAGTQGSVFATGVDRITGSSIQKAVVLKCKPY